MKWSGCDLDCLAARVHARRSRLAERDRLKTLCRTESFPEFARALYPGANPLNQWLLQRQLLEDLGAELWDASLHLSRPARQLLQWLVQRFHVENLKVAVRAIESGLTRNEIENLLLSCSGVPKMDAQAIAMMPSLRALVAALPEGPLRGSADSILQALGDEANGFLVEAGLDRGYCIELLARGDRLRGEEKPLARSLILQEIDAFHLMLVIRGKFHYGLTPATLMLLHIEGTAIERERFASMLSKPDAFGAGREAVGRALDAMQSTTREESGTDMYFEAAAMEALTWRRLARLADRVFRRSHMGVAAIFAYGIMRRIEVANLITLSEGIRLDINRDRLWDRTIQRPGAEGTNA